MYFLFVPMIYSRPNLFYLLLSGRSLHSNDVALVLSLNMDAEGNAPCTSNSSSLTDSIDFLRLSRTAVEDLISLDIERLPGDVVITNGNMFDLLSGFDKVTSKEADVIPRLIRVFLFKDPPPDFFHFLNFSPNLLIHTL